VRHRDGRWLDWTDRGTAAWDESGQPLRWIGACTDVTDRKRAEEALRESEERYALAARAANDGLWDWDLRTGEVYFSPRWKEMAGYRDFEIGSRPRSGSSASTQRTGSSWPPPSRLIWQAARRIWNANTGSCTRTGAIAGC
jgi:PAS domain-containing protein